MSDETVIITIDENGEMVLEVKGCKGKSCKDLTRQLEKDLGGASSDRLTAEYYQQADTRKGVAK